MRSLLSLVACLVLAAPASAQVGLLTQPPIGQSVDNNANTLAVQLIGDIDGTTLVVWTYAVPAQGWSVFLNTIITDVNRQGQNICSGSAILTNNAGIIQCGPTQPATDYSVKTFTIFINNTTGELSPVSFTKFYTTGN